MTLRIRKEEIVLRQEEIRIIAYQLWEQEGCVIGRDCEHWGQAEQIWEDKQKKQKTPAGKKSASKSISRNKKSK
jgi:hypothetical protein